MCLSPHELAVFAGALEGRRRASRHGVRGANASLVRANAVIPAHVRNETMLPSGIDFALSTLRRRSAPRRAATAPSTRHVSELGHGRFLENCKAQRIKKQDGWPQRAGPPIQRTSTLCFPSSARKTRTRLGTARTSNVFTSSLGFPEFGGVVESDQGSTKNEDCQRRLGAVVLLCTSLCPVHRQAVGIKLAFGSG